MRIDYKTEKVGNSPTFFYEIRLMRYSIIAGTSITRSPVPFVKVTFSSTIQSFVSREGICSNSSMNMMPASPAKSSFTLHSSVSMDIPKEISEKRRKFRIVPYLLMMALSSEIASTLSWLLIPEQ